MSFEEIKKREKKMSFRKRYSLILTILIIITSLISVISLAFNVYANEIVNVEFKETGSVNYNVRYITNDYFDNVQPGQAYIGTLIDEISSDFKYNFDLEKENINFTYKYTIEKYIDISSVTNGSLEPYDYELLVSEEGASSSTEKFSINKNIVVSYKNANAKASEVLGFIDDSLLSAKLTVKMTVKIKSETDGFKDENEYVIQYQSPLVVQTTKVLVTSTTPNASNKVISCLKSKKLASFTKIIFPISFALDLMFVVALIVLLNVASDKYIKYSIKVKKILKGYKSFIQVTTTNINLKDYKLIKIQTIREMLEIRETLSLPLIMNENDEKTCSKFYIIKDNFMYIYSICVDGYEHLMYDDENSNPNIEKLHENTASLTDTKSEKNENVPAIEKKENPDITQNEGNDQEPEDFDQESSEDTNADNENEKYIYGFDAKLTLSNDKTKNFYSEIEAFVLDYGVKIKKSFKKQRIYLGKNVFAEMLFRGKKLAICLALKPEGMKDLNIKYTDLSKIKQYKDLPLQIKLTTKSKVEFVKTVLKLEFERAELEKKNLNIEPKQIETKTVEQLIKEEKIKVKK